jgi:N-acetyl-anhydromuramyl-L-alanine amidase AmpD
MAQSSEYPDLRWVEANSWSSGRPYGRPKLLVVHYTAGSEGPLSAENGAEYDRTRTDGTSTHFFVDRDSTIQCVLTRNMAHAARRHGNHIGIQYELCGTTQTRAQWLDEASRPTIRNAAKQIVRDGHKWGIPLRRITSAQTRAAYYSGGAGGICGHVNCTEAFPEDDGDHTDPGTAFPWDVLLADVEEFAKGGGGDDVTQNEFNTLMDEYARRTSGVDGTSQAQRTLRDRWRLLVGYGDIMAQVEQESDEVLAGLPLDAIADAVVAKLPPGSGGAVEVSVDTVKQALRETLGSLDNQS